MRGLGMVASAIGASLFATSIAAAAPAEEQLERGSNLVEQGRSADAVPVLAEAYRALEPSQRVGELGRYVVGLASQASRDAATPTIAAEELALLEEYFGALDDARGRGTPTIAADGEEAALRERMRELAAAREAETQPPPPSAAASDDAAVTRPSAPAKSTDRPRDATGIGLVTAGAVLTAGGIGMLAAGLRFPALIDRAEADARRKYDVPDGEQPPNWPAHARAEERKGQALLGIGIAAAVVGVGLLSYGAYRLVRARRHTTARMPLRWGAHGVVLVLPEL